MRIASYLILLVAVSTTPLRAQTNRGARSNVATINHDNTATKALVIVRSTRDYDDARRVAVKASTKLRIPLDLRGLEPHANIGLTFTIQDCEESEGEYPCYVARGRFDDGEYVSIEHSNAYDGFARDLYIVIVASGPASGDTAERRLRAAKAHYRDAYVRVTSIYMGCIH